MRGMRARPIDLGRARARHLASTFGRELRLARLTAGLTQAQVAKLAGGSQQTVSFAERGSQPISLDVRCRLVAAVGHELGWRLYPVASVSLRDSGQLALAQAIAGQAHASWHITLERPVAAGDARAADMVLVGAEEVLHVEIERALVDAQAQIRAAQVKRETLAAGAQRPVRLVLAVPDTSGTRDRLRGVTDLIERAFPIPAPVIWRSIRRAAPLDGDGILFVRVRRSAAGSMTRHGRRRPAHPADPAPRRP